MAEIEFEVWWVPQVPMKAFTVPVASIMEGRKICEALAAYDLFQLEHRVKPDFCNDAGPAGSSTQTETIVKFWFDTEFIEDGKTIDLISIGVVAEDGREFYAINSDCDYDKASQWVRDNVLVHLKAHTETYLSRSEIRDAVLQFVGEYPIADGPTKPEFWAYYADYDWVVLCQLFGTMMDLPKGWPMYCRDVKQLCDMLGNPKLPEQGKGEHHALADAKWTKSAWHFLFAEWERQHNESPTL